MDNKDDMFNNEDLISKVYKKWEEAGFLTDQSEDFKHKIFTLYEKQLEYTKESPTFGLSQEQWDVLSKAFDKINLK